MLLRLTIAIVGGVLITTIMLLSMSEFAAMFRERSSDRLFLIDVLPAPERGRPARPGAAALPPERQVDRLEADPTGLGLDAVAEPGAAVDASAELPTLEPPAVAQD